MTSPGPLSAILLSASLALLSAAALSAAPYDYDVHAAQELRARDGLPNLFARAQAGEEVRVAYVGGSITAAEGWRPKTLAWLREQYPGAEFTEINAAISGTGSDFAACRLQLDVLQHRPNLVFIEFRVNGGGGFAAKSMEGVVRQIWAADPTTDICFVYTVCEWLLAPLQEGRNDAWDSFGATAEEIANRYGIPTIDLGPEVVSQLATGDWVYKADSAPEGKQLFSQDGTHPTDAGHELYRDVIARSLDAMRATGVAGPRELGEPMDAGAWTTATLLPVREAALSDGWEPVADMAQDPVTGADAGRTWGMLRDAIRCDHVGASITVRFNGTALAFTDVPGTEPIVLEMTIDGGEAIEMTRLSSENVRLYARYAWTPELPPGDHTVTLTVKSLPPDTAFYAGQFWVVGKPTTP